MCIEFYWKLDKLQNLYLIFFKVWIAISTCLYTAVHDSLKKKGCLIYLMQFWAPLVFGPHEIFVFLKYVEQIRISVLECFSNILHHALSNLDVQETVLVLKICVRWRLRSLQWPSFLSYSITCINTCWLFGFQFFLNLICKVNIGEFLSCKLMQLGNWCPISLWGNNCLKGKKTGWKFHLTAYPLLDILFCWWIDNRLSGL